MGSKRGNMLGEGKGNYNTGSIFWDVSSLVLSLKVRYLNTDEEC